MNTITLMVHSQNLDIELEEDNDFTIFLSVSLFNDFKNSNVTRQEMLTQYVSKVYELYLNEKKVDKIINSFEAQENTLPNIR